MNKDIGQQAAAHLALGNSLLLKDQFIESYQDFLHAQYLIELLNDKNEKRKLKKLCYNHLFQFFDKLQDFEKARNYKSDQILQILDEDKTDSLELMWAKLDLIGISIRDNNFKDLHLQLEEILDYADHIHHEKLHDYTLSHYRTFLLDTNDSEGYYKLYHEKFPDELKKMEISNPLSFYIIKAHIAEYKKDHKGARLYYEKAEKIIMEDKSYAYKSNFFRRFGQFHLKNNNTEEALNAFHKSYALASKHPYLEYMIETTAYIDTLSYAAGNIEDAYKYAKIHHDLLKSQSEVAKGEAFMIMNLKNESKRMELIQQQEAETKKKKFDLQYLFITALISFLLVLFVVASQMKVPIWVIKGSGFLGILMLFEFVILILDHEIHHMTHGAPFWIFIIKVIILFVLFPLHHLVEKAVINYMLDKKLVVKPVKGSLKKVLHAIWPWMKED